MMFPSSSIATTVRPGGLRIHPARARASVRSGSHVRVSPAEPSCFKISQMVGQSLACASRITMQTRMARPALICRQSCLRGALARDDDGSVVCCFSKAAYVAGIAGEDAVAGRSEEYYGRVDRV